MILEKKINYRKIYEDFYGKIGVDENGRSLEVHHLDNNHENNDPSNLKLVTIQEHYDIHYSQGDWGACKLILTRMALTPQEISKRQSELTAKFSNERVANGSHNFLVREDGSSLGAEINKKRIEEGTHHLLRRVDGTSHATIRLAAGTHPFSGKNNPVYRQLEDETHPFLGGKIQSESNNNRVNEGTHPSQNKVSCLYCNKVMGQAQFFQWHGKKCKLFKGVTV